VIAGHRAADDELAGQFIACLDDTDVRPGLIDSIRRFEAGLSARPGATVEWRGGPFSGGVGRVSIEYDADRLLVAVKTARGAERENGILETLKHPLVLQAIRFDPAAKRGPAIATEFVGNGSLADRLPGSENFATSGLRGPTRIAKIIVSIALAMRFVHSRGFIHCNLTPDAVLLDWDWNVRISHFGSAVAPDDPEITDSASVNAGDARYRAPECYENEAVPESDVFSFGLIRFEIAAGRPVFARTMRQS
jgi:serine/threonine protein kinase